MHIQLNSNIQLKYLKDKQCFLVYLNNKIFFKQNFIDSIDYTYLLVILVLYKYGLVNLSKKNVCI